MVTQLQTLLSKFQAALKNFAETGNTILVSVAKDPFHVLELLAESPNGMRIILHWAGDENISENTGLVMSRNKFEVILSYNLGLTLQPDIALITGLANRPALYQIVDDLRAYIMSFLFPANDTAQILEYGGCQPYVTPDGVKLAAYQMTFFLNSTINIGTPVEI